MKGSSFFKAASLLSSLVAPLVNAQAVTDIYTDAATGIQFERFTIDESQTKGGFQWGYALPGTASGSNDEYIGLLVGSLQTGAKGWAGISHAGGMPNSLLLMGWVDGSNVKTQFVWAGGYVAPEPYKGNATLTQISHTINATHFSLIYRCQWCWAWDQNGADGSQLPTGEVQVIGWAQHLDVPSNPIVFHNNGQSQFGAPVAAARNAKYTDWVKKAGSPSATPTGTPVVTPTATPTPTGPVACSGTAAPSGTYDYIIVGAGAGGIPIADKLSESGKSVLLIEKGPPSSGRWGGTMKPAWLEGTNLTRFDVPGLCNQIWHDSAGIACTDTDQMAGCVLGGGTAVNAALWWKPNPVDWDYNFPSGWKSADVSKAIDNVFKRIPGTDHPSVDGKLYKQEGFNVLATALSAGGYKEIVANNNPSQKDKVFAHTPYMYEHGERGGPMSTYLVTASARKNFKLWMNTGVRRVIRKGSQVTGVELEGGAGGYCGTVNLNAGGRVILSAGTFGSAKLLFRSGIGPTAQLNVVKGSVQDGATMISQDQWINLPVGQNLNDHVNTDLVIQHPNISFYDFYAAWDAPPTADKDAYLNKRSGILAQSAPNIGPMYWEVVKGTDGIERSMQYTSRVEGPRDGDIHSMTMSQYLGRGSTSRGVAAINGGLSMYVSKAPYLSDKADLEAVITSIENIQKIIAKVPEITWQVPAANVTAREYVNSLPLTPAARRSNHWIGTAKMGTDSGLTGGTSVVDTNTKVYGTDNLHVVDASIFPGHITTNPSSYIVVAAEQAAMKILALGSATPPTTTKPGATPSATAVAAYLQCGGNGYTGLKNCVSGYTCKAWNDYYSQCVPK
ncbi:hypothetical protein GQ43DRAFT_389286 [Delitschia confertaspora ATCC 74209]|uniref:CBM1 domain-containing protein n=1 Tax=Delitschia confertaspora ATCC 74209 TaxID=1513339 RepID=A0A9P4MY15_9PLEO|nr:hypothetical protein GQ43DRAFT_389286 [Delitschia confertaspora ATCC 74209]